MVATLWKRGGREFVARFGGTSMEPTIPAGAEVRVTCETRPEVGEVGFLILRGRPVVHRVVARAPDGAWVLTRGDASLIPDPPLRESDLVGRVVSVCREGRHQPPGPGSGSRARRLTLWAAMVLLRRSPAATRCFVGLLWLARRVFVAAPRVVWRRILDPSRRDHA